MAPNLGPALIQLLTFVALVSVYRFLVVHLSGISCSLMKPSTGTGHATWIGATTPNPLRGWPHLAEHQAVWFWRSGVKALGMLTYPATALAMVGFARAPVATSGAYALAPWQAPCT